MAAKKPENKRGKALTLEVMQTVVPKNYKTLVSQETVDEINHLVEDPDYGEEFRENMLTWTSVLDGSEKWSMAQYITAIKYYSLTAAGLSQVDAYCKTYPERLQARLDRGQGKQDISGEASRYNSSVLVNKIRQQALVPLHLVNQGTTQMAINELTRLMLNSRSDVARVSAATALLKELRPPDTQQISLEIGMSEDAKAAQERQSQQLLEIAENQRRLLQAGASLQDIQSIHIRKEEVIEGEIDE